MFSLFLAASLLYQNDSLLKDDLATGPLLLHFYTNWCPPCKQMESVISKFEAAGNRVLHMNTDLVENQKWMRQYNVEAIPTFVGLKDGQEKKRLTGIITLEQLTSLYIKEPTKPIVSLPDSFVKVYMESGNIINYSSGIFIDQDGYGLTVIAKNVKIDKIVVVKEPINQNSYTPLYEVGKIISRIGSILLFKVDKQVANSVIDDSRMTSNPIMVAARLNSKNDINYFIHTKATLIRENDNDLYYNKLLHPASIGGPIFNKSQDSDITNLPLCGLIGGTYEKVGRTYFIDIIGLKSQIENLIQEDKKSNNWKSVTKLAGQIEQIE